MFFLKSKTKSTEASANQSYREVSQDQERNSLSSWIGGVATSDEDEDSLSCAPIDMQGAFIADAVRVLEPKLASKSRSSSPFAAESKQGFAAESKRGFAADGERTVVKKRINEAQLAKVEAALPTLNATVTKLPQAKALSSQEVAGAVALEEPLEIALPKSSKPVLAKKKFSTSPDLSLSAEADLERRFGMGIKTALQQGSFIEGVFEFDEPVRIEGDIRGEIHSKGVLVIGTHSLIRAKINVGTLIILGVVQGEVNCSELLEIRSGGGLRGDVSSRRIAIEDGAGFVGKCQTLD